MSDLKVRLISASVALAILIAALYLGGVYLKGFLFIISLIMSYELVNALKKVGFNIPLVVFFMGNALHFATYLFDLPAYFSLMMIFFILGIFFVFNNEVDLNDIGYGLLVVVYIPYLLYPVIPLVNTIYLYMIFVIAFSTDTFAYFIGSKMGKHKLMPIISPNKSVEGAVGGTIGCVIISILVLHYTNHPWNGMTIFWIILMSVLGQIGDLFASAIKRKTGIKDFGYILPGHGGILDRLDSMLFIIPMMYFYTQFIV